MQINKYNFKLQTKSIAETGKFSGYASVFDIIDNHNDVIAHGAFSKFLAENQSLNNIKLLWQHNANEPIGYFTEIFEDEYGLYVEGQILCNLEKGKEAYSLLKSGAIDGLSIGFTINDFEYDENVGFRIINEAELWEISLVTFPANKNAKIFSVKSQNPDESKIINSIDRAISCLQSNICD